MTTVRDDGGDDLDRLLAGLAAVPRDASDQLVTRILGDADRVQRDAAAGRRAGGTASPGAHAGFWARLVQAVGGAGAVAGLGTAAVAGVALGVLQPASLSGVTAAVWGETATMSVDLLPDTGDLWTEG